MDLCGEPQFFDDALLAFDRQARDAGLLAIHAAAFDCVPAELGSVSHVRFQECNIVYLMLPYSNNFPLVLLAGLGRKRIAEEVFI